MWVAWVTVSLTVFCYVLGTPNYFSEPAKIIVRVLKIANKKKYTAAAGLKKRLQEPGMKKFVQDGYAAFMDSGAKRLLPGYIWRYT